jgi:myo-inositol-1(or 4)-monophosphatase
MPEPLHRGSSTPPRRITATPSNAFLPVLRPILERAGQAALAHFRSVRRDLKPDGSDITVADYAAEEVLVDGLTSAFPNMGVISEEGARVTGGEGTWYIDPIDGTGAFLDQLAHWGPTACLVRDDVIVAGAFWMPRLQELWFGERGHGAWLNGAALQPRWPATIRPYDALYLPSRYHRVDNKIPWRGKVRALGSTAAHLAQVAGGGGAAAVVPRWALWDLGCGIVMLEELGGVFTDLQFRPLDPIAQVGTPLIAGAPAAIHHLAPED